MQLCMQGGACGVLLVAMPEQMAAMSPAAGWPSVVVVSQNMLYIIVCVCVRVLLARVYMCAQAVCTRV